MSVYKSEDAKTIYEYLNKRKAELEEEVSFINALTRELRKGQMAQEELSKKKQQKIDESWDSIEK